ncbi:hypothetical protein TcG_10471 [Trypanosoma cruzi]|nr:hypothetical protein TcG_10471 [Trypanosoma cruzi]
MVRRPLCVQPSVICIFLPVGLAGAARRCKQPLIIRLLGLFFFFARREKQLFLHVTCWSASMLPTGHHAAVPFQCSSCASYCAHGPFSALLFAGPWPAVPIGRLLTF